MKATDWHITYSRLHQRNHFSSRKFEGVIRSSILRKFFLIFGLKVSEFGVNIIIAFFHILVTCLFFCVLTSLGLSSQKLRSRMPHFF